MARLEAEAAERSITGQIEHWAKLGRAVETVLTYSESRAVKVSQGNLARAFGDTSARRRVQASIEDLVGSPDRSRAVARLRGRKPVYESDPTYPGMVVRVNPDGRRSIGRVVNRRFVPEHPDK
jgi:hypothetical protein